MTLIDLYIQILYHYIYYNKRKSIITIFAIASTIGGALGKTQGSCLPLASNITS